MHPFSMRPSEDFSRPTVGHLEEGHCIGCATRPRGFPGGRGGRPGAELRPHQVRGGSLLAMRTSCGFAHRLGNLTRFIGPGVGWPNEPVSPGGCRPRVMQSRNALVCELKRFDTRPGRRWVPGRRITGPLAMRDRILLLQSLVSDSLLTAIDSASRRRWVETRIPGTPLAEWRIVTTTPVPAFHLLALFPNDGHPGTRAVRPRP